MNATELLTELKASSLGRWNLVDTNTEAAKELASLGLAEIIDATNSRSRKTMGLVVVRKEIRITPAGLAA